MACAHASSAVPDRGEEKRPSSRLEAELERTVDARRARARAREGVAAPFVLGPEGNPGPAVEAREPAKEEEGEKGAGMPAWKEAGRDENEGMPRRDRRGAAGCVSPRESGQGWGRQAG